MSLQINNMNKTSSATSLRNKEYCQGNQTRKIRKYYIKQRINYSKSAVDFNKRTRNERNQQKSSKNIIERNKNKILDKVDVSKNIFTNLEKIEKTLLRKYQQKFGNNNNNNDILNIIKNNYNHGIENFDNIIPEDDLKEKYNRNRNNQLLNNNIEKTYDSITFKSRSSINFFNKKISKTIFLKRKNEKIPKRLKSTVERSPKHITRFLERKVINDIPVTYPLYISYNNLYKSMSEKNRVDRILSKLICLKTHIVRDNLNKYDIIKEFLLKNGFKDDKYFMIESIDNLYHYLLQPFTFPPEYILADIINDGIKYKNKYISDEINKSDENICLKYEPKKNNFIQTEKNKYKTRNKNKKSRIIYKMMMDNKSKNHFYYSGNQTIVNKTLPTLIKDLETELRQIRIEKMAKLDKYNNLLTKKPELVNVEDKNKYVPNLCLISKGFKERCKENVDKINRKIILTKNKQEKLKEINNRLYYDIIRKHNMAEFDRTDIQRKLKLTEFVFMERAKKKYLFESAKSNYVTVLKRIKSYKLNKSKKPN